jgi:MarR-like DNA-binding transcriptional regulator SgrR of sgrS sRNA
LVRIPLPAPDPWIALAGVANFAGLPTAKNHDGVEDLYASEVGMLGTLRLIPLFHLPVSYASATRLKSWTLRPDGSFSLADAWLASDRQ